MELLDVWNHYKDETVFNYSVLPDEIKNKGETFVFEPKKQIIAGGDFPKYIYFILSGTAAGIREYVDGNEYRYFQLDATNGCIGLLEMLARKEQYIATIISLTNVTVVRIDSAIIYSTILTDISLLRRCTSLLAQDLYQRSGNDGLFYYPYELAEYCDRILLLCNGRIAMQGETKEVLTNPQVLKYGGQLPQVVLYFLERMRQNQKTGEIPLTVEQAVAILKTGDNKRKLTFSYLHIYKIHTMKEKNPGA